MFPIFRRQELENLILDLMKETPSTKLLFISDTIKLDA